MKKAIYIGKSERLNGKTCIVRKSGRQGWVFAQFDDRYLEESVGWHEFPVDNFVVDGWCPPASFHPIKLENSDHYQITINDVTYLPVDYVNKLKKKIAAKALKDMVDELNDNVLLAGEDFFEYVDKKLKELNDDTA